MLQSCAVTHCHHRGWDQPTTSPPAVRSSSPAQWKPEMSSSHKGGVRTHFWLLVKCKRVNLSCYTRQGYLNLKAILSEAYWSYFPTCCLCQCCMQRTLGLGDGGSAVFYLKSMRKENVVEFPFFFEVCVPMHQDNNSLRDRLYFKCALWTEDRIIDLVPLACVVQEIKEGVCNCILGTWPMPVSQIQHK